MRFAFLDYALSFAQSVIPIGRQVGLHFLFSRRPKHLDLVHAIVRAQTKVESQIVLRKITSPAADLTSWTRSPAVRRTRALSASGLPFVAVSPKLAQ